MGSIGCPIFGANSIPQLVFDGLGPHFLHFSGKGSAVSQVVPGQVHHGPEPLTSEFRQVALAGNGFDPQFVVGSAIHIHGGLKTMISAYNFPCC